MIRILHTADWHLGKRLEGRSRHEEQVAVLQEICEVVEREEIDAVLLAGDVYDTYNPPSEAEALYYRTMIRLVDGGRRPVVVIAGNHDSPDRLKASDPYGHALGVVTLGLPDETVETFDHGPGKCALLESAPSFLKLRLRDGTPLNVIPLPYPSEARLGRLLSERLDDEEAGSRYERAVRELMEVAAERFSEGEANVVMSHLFVAGGLESESERQIQVGGAHSVSPGSFPSSTDYVALGHLHRPQQFAGRNDIAVRYSGSPLSYSFSEAGQQKSVTILEIDRGEVNQRLVELKAGRPLIDRKGLKGVGELEAFLDEVDRDAWISFSVELTEALDIGYVEEMHRRHPGILSPHFDYQSADPDQPQQEQVSSLPLEEQFRRFVRSKDEEPANEVVELFLKLAEEA